MRLTFYPAAMRGVRFRNRIVVSPMCEYSCVDAWRTTGTSFTSAAALSAAPAR
jgi:2,4-dienoyl-CoA reductase-like NADH-dependent reductase (Old Yellow Enzyme family)